MEENNNTNLTDSALMEQILSEVKEEAVENSAETQETEEQVGATQSNDAETQETEVTEEDGVKETVVSEPTTNAEANKTEAIKALKAKVKELSLELAKRDEDTTEVEEETKVDSLTELASLIGQDPEHIKELIKQKKAESQGMTPEVLDKFEELNSKLKEFDNEKKQKLEETRINNITNIVEKLQSEGLKEEADIKEFFEKAKNEFGIDLKENPNEKTALALFKGSIGESFKDKIEQSTLQKIKDGEVVDIDSNESDSLKTKQKQEEEAFNKLVEQMMNEADKRVGIHKK